MTRVAQKMIPVAVFDISSSSVAGAHALVRSHENLTDSITILAQAKFDTPLQEHMDIVRYVDDTVHHLERVIESVQKLDTHHPETIQLVLASPWYTSQTRTIVYKKTTPFICTQKLVDDLVEKEVAHIIETTEGNLGDVGHEYVIVEKQLSLVKLNGYATSLPYGKRAETLEVYLTITVAPKIVIERFKASLARAYGTRPIQITTSSYTTFVMVRDHFGVESECVVIDVGEEVTDVAFIKDNLFLYEHSFPVGTYALYRALAESGGYTALEAKALLESYRLGKAGASSKAIEDAITAFKNTWQKGFQQILDEGQYGFCLPEECFITADPRFEILFTDTIKNDPFIQHTCSRGVVRPIFISSEYLGGKVRTLAGAPPDVALSTVLLFVERLLQ